MIYCHTTVWVKTVCTEVVLCCRLGGSSTRQRMVLLFQSHERDSRKRWNCDFFFPFPKASRNGDLRRLIRVTKMLHKPDVFKKNCSLNRLFIFLLISNMTAYFLLTRYCGVLLDVKQFFFFLSTTTRYLHSQYIVTFASFCLSFFRASNTFIL